MKTFDKSKIREDVWEDFCEWYINGIWNTAKLPDSLNFPELYGYATVGGYLESKGVDIMREYRNEWWVYPSDKKFRNPQDALIAAFNEVREK